MIQRRKIAIAYACSIPVYFAFLFFELATLYRLNAQQRGTMQEIARIEKLSGLLVSLQDTENVAWAYFASRDDRYRSQFNGAASKLMQSIQDLDQPPDVRTETQAGLENLQQSAVGVLANLRHEVDDSATRKRPAAWPEISASGPSAPMTKILAGLIADQRTFVNEQQANAARSASTLNALLKYGGALTIWTLGVAALLLFYDDKRQVREHLEQRLHTDVLESLPMAVCLTSESGVILYANPAAEEFFGYKPGELVARNMERLQRSEHSGGPQMPELLAKLLPQEMWSGELSVTASSGDIIRTDSWMANLRVGEKYCRLLLHKPVIAAGSTGGCNTT